MTFVPPSTGKITDEAKIRVMVVDDSLVIRGFIARALEGDPEVQVVQSRDGAVEPRGSGSGEHVQRDRDPAARLSRSLDVAGLISGQRLEAPRQEPRDVHLAHADRFGDLGLRHVFEVAHVHDALLALR